MGSGFGGEQPQIFSKGSQVEVGTDEEGFAGSWYVATVIDTPARSLSSVYKKKSPKYYVEYQSLLDDDGVTPLREHVNFEYLRPFPPSEPDPVHSFELHDVVDAFYRDGWWTGVITRLLDNSRFVVTFQNPPDEIQFTPSELRIHGEWVQGKWVRPEKQRTTGLTFSAGKRVEVSFDKENYRDAWFPSILLEDLGNNSFLVEHQSFGNGDKVVLLKETVDSLHIRPPPPHLKDINFVLLEKVDVFYDFGWWSGVITKELADKRYIVYFKHINKAMELTQLELRPHLDWIDGKWIGASQDIIIPSDYQERVGHACNAAKNTYMPVQNRIPSSGAAKDNSEEKTLFSLSRGENLAEQSTSCNGKISMRKKTKQNPISDVSHSRPSKKLKEVNAIEIQTPSKENPSCFPSPPMGSAGTDCLSQSTVRDQPSAKTQNNSQGRKVMQLNKQQKVDESDYHTAGDVKRRGRPKLLVKRPQPSEGGKKGDASANTGEEVDDEVCLTKEIDSSVILGLPCNARTSLQSKKPLQLPSEESLKLTSDQKSQLTDPARDVIKDIHQLKAGESSVKKRRGRPPKLLGKSLGGSGSDKSDKRNGDEVAADEMVSNGSMTNEVELPTLTGAGCKKPSNSPTRDENVLSNVMKMPRTKKGRQPNLKVVEASSKNLEKPASKKERRRSLHAKIGTPSQDSQDATRGKRQEGFGTDSTMKVGMVVDESPSNNMSDDQPLSTWFEGMQPAAVDGSRVSPHATGQQCTQASNIQIQIAAQAAGVDGNGDVSLDPNQNLPSVNIVVDSDDVSSDPNQSLPFVKTVPLWKTIESMEVFQVTPQKPHFRPLDKCKESSREGLAIGCMVNFSSVVKKTSELQFDDPRSSIEDNLETLLDLERHGFDVTLVRHRLTGFLRIKDRQEVLQDQLKEIESQLVEHNHEKTNLEEEMEKIDKQIRELQEKRALVALRKELNETETASLKSRVNSVDECFRSIRLDFKELATAAW